MTGTCMPRAISRAVAEVGAGFVRDSCWRLSRLRDRQMIGLSCLDILDQQVFVERSRPKRSTEFREHFVTGVSFASSAGRLIRSHAASGRSARTRDRIIAFASRSFSQKPAAAGDDPPLTSRPSSVLFRTIVTVSGAPEPRTCLTAPTCSPDQHGLQALLPSSNISFGREAGSNPPCRQPARVRSGTVHSRYWKDRCGRSDIGRWT